MAARACPLIAWDHCKTEAKMRYVSRVIAGGLLAGVAVGCVMSGMSDDSRFTRLSGEEASGIWGAGGAMCGLIVDLPINSGCNEEPCHAVSTMHVWMPFYWGAKVVSGNCRYQETGGGWKTCGVCDTLTSCNP